MIPFTTLNTLLGLATLGAQLFVIALLVDLFFFKGAHLVKKVAPYALLGAFLVALGASLLTLVYEFGYGIPPCPLCWWQRIFLYPQVLLFGAVLWGIRIAPLSTYTIILSLAGMAVALYHHALQIFPDSLPCPADALCAQRHIFELGYITFPLMAATTFALLIVLSIGSRRS